MLDKGVEAFLTARIDKNNAEPMYLQIAAALKELLQAGKFSSDTPMPTERRILAERFGVSWF